MNTSKYEGIVESNTENFREFEILLSEYVLYNEIDKDSINLK